MRLLYNHWCRIVSVFQSIPKPRACITLIFVPVELSWKLGDSGFAIKTGLGIDTPDGTVTARLVQETREIRSGPSSLK